MKNKNRDAGIGNYNPDFWELPLGAKWLESMPNEAALWHETPEDRRNRQAFKDFCQTVMPAIKELLNTLLTKKQREAFVLYYLYGKTQDEIAVILSVNQSTVSRHLFGTFRRGKKVGGALPKIKRAIAMADCPTIIQEQLKILQAVYHSAA